MSFRLTSDCGCGDPAALLGRLMEGRDTGRLVKTRTEPGLPQPGPQPTCVQVTDLLGCHLIWQYQFRGGNQPRILFLGNPEPFLHALSHKRAGWVVGGHMSCQAPTHAASIKMSGYTQITRWYSCM